MESENPQLARLNALKATRLLDSPPEQAFDRLTALASRALGAPVALISLVDDQRQFFKSAEGLPAPLCDLRQTPLSHSFCQHVVAVGEALVVRDARVHPLLEANLAVKEMGVVAYAGVPLTDSANHSLGSLCVLDFKPREWTPEDIDLLKALAAQTMTEIEMRDKALGLNRDLSELQKQDTERRARARHTIHDLRTPLSSLILSLEVLEGLGLTAEQKDWLALSKNSGLALKELVDALVDNEVQVQKEGPAGVLGEFSLRFLAETALGQVKGAAHAKKLVLTTDFGADLPKVRVDDQKIIRTLVNLLGNAVKFTPEGGSIRCSLRRIPGNRLAFAVTDTGIGFEQKHATAIFEKGVTLDPTARSSISTGWGLEFCKRVADAHRGSIEVVSAPGAGSTFTLILPLAG